MSTRKVPIHHLRLRTTFLSFLKRIYPRRYWLLSPLFGPVWNLRLLSNTTFIVIYTRFLIVVKWFLIYSYCSFVYFFNTCGKLIVSFRLFLTLKWRHLGDLTGLFFFSNVINNRSYTPLPESMFRPSSILLCLSNFLTVKGYVNFYWIRYRVV